MGKSNNSEYLDSATEQKIRALPEYEKLKLAMEKPNFFSIMKMETMEIRHSNFLAWLLDPNGTHNLRELFLKWFLKELVLENATNSDSEKILSPEMIDEINWTKVNVFREVSNQSDFLDILIVYEDETPEKTFTVSIENKVFSKDHDHQLSRYVEMVKARSPKCIESLNKNDKDFFVYLTPSGDSPTEYSDKNNKWWLFSYDQFLDRIDFILESYRDRMSDKVFLYLSDYRDNLSRNVLENDSELEQLEEDLLESVNKMDIGTANKSQDDVIQAALNHIDLNANIKEIVEEFEKASSDAKHVRFYPRLDERNKKRLKELEECNRNGGANLKQHYVNFELFLFELIVNRSKEGMTVSLKAVVGPSIYHKELVNFFYEKLNTLGYLKRPRDESIWHSLLTRPIFTVFVSKEEDVVIEAKLFMEENKKTIESIEKVFNEWLTNYNSKTGE